MLEDVFMLLTDKYADKIYGMITCYDRMIIQGDIPGWSGHNLFAHKLQKKEITYRMHDNA